MESSFYTTEIAPGMMASSSDSPSSAFALSLLPAHSSAAIRVSSHGSPDIYRIATPATPTPSASLSGIHSHRAGPSADGTLMATGRAGMTGAQPTYPKGDTTSELYESHTANLPSRIIPFQDMGDDYAVSGPHVLCVSRASEERLLSTGNVANTLAKDKIKVLTHELQSLRIEADVQRKLYEELISKVPQLLGMTPDLDYESLGAMVSPSVVHGRVVLGLGWAYPQPRARPENVAFRYWYASDYKERPNKGGKQGQHDNSVNIAQRFVEDEQGQPVPGTVAKDIREMLRSLLHSLVWSGQAAASQDHLPHEARVYVHVSLARRFPFLLLCDGGSWKINTLIKQMYHGFSGNHIKGVLSHTKPEPSEPDHHLLGPRSTPGPSGESQKRARQGSLGASLSSNKPSKILRISPAPSPCDGPAASASQVASQFPSRASSSTGSASGHISGSITSNTAASATVPSLVPTLHVGPVAFQVATSAGEAAHLTGAAIGTSSTVPDDFASAATADIAPAHGIQGGADSTGKGPDVQTRMPGTAAPSSAEEANQAPSPTPAGDSLQSSHSTQQQSAVDIELSQHPEAVVTTVTIPVKKPFTASSGSRRRSSRFVQSAHDSEPDAQPDMSEAEGTGAAASSIGKSTTRVSAAPGEAEGPPGVPAAAALPGIAGQKKRAPKGAIVLAKAKYKPDVVSEQMLFMGRMIATDPTVSHADYLDAFKKLTSEAHEELKKECAQVRKQKRNQQGSTSSTAER